MSNGRNGVVWAPPYNIECEQAVLGCVLLDADCVYGVAQIITAPDSFYDPKHQRIWAAMKSLLASKAPIDPATLSARLGIGASDDVSWGSYIAELTGAVPTSANHEHYARLVEEAAAYRRLIQQLHKAYQSAFKESRKPREFVAELADSLYRAAGVDHAGGIQSVRQLLPEYDKALAETAAKARAKQPLGMKTGIYELDYYFPFGLSDTTLLIIAARPSNGKSSLMLNLAWHWIRTYDCSGLIVTLEGSKQEVIDRLHRIACPSREFQTLYSPSDPLKTLALLHQSRPLLDTDRLHIEDTEMKIENLCYLIRAHVQRHPECKFVCFDYLQLIQVADKYATRDAVGKLDYVLARIAELRKEIKRTVVLLCQLSRQAEGKDAPTLSDLKGSGTIEQDGDVILGLCKNDDAQPMDATVECHILKNRNGQTGVTKLRFAKPQFLITSRMRPRDDALPNPQGVLLGVGLNEPEDFEDDGVPF